MNWKIDPKIETRAPVGLSFARRFVTQFDTSQVDWFKIDTGSSNGSGAGVWGRCKHPNKRKGLGYRLSCHVNMAGLDEYHVPVRRRPVYVEYTQAIEDEDSVRLTARALLPAGHELGLLCLNAMAERAWFRVKGQTMQLMEANKEWMTRPADQRFETLQALRDAVHGRRMRSCSETVLLPDVKVEAKEDALVVNSGLTPSAPTHWSFGQLSRLAGAPAGYLRTLPPTLAADCLNTSLQRTAREDMKAMRVRDDEGGLDRLQAVTSTTYGRIWDADVADAVGRIVARSGGRFFNPKDWSGKPSGLYASDHDVFMFMIDGGSMVDGGGNDQLHRGFITWNSETGARSFGLMTFLFRVVCGNHIIWDAQDVTKMIVYHTSGGPNRFDREALPSLLQYVNASAAPVEEQIRRAKTLRLEAAYSLPGEVALNDVWVTGFAKKHGFTKGEVKNAVKMAVVEEGQCDSVWDLVQGLTRSARALEYIDARVDLEKRAGNLMELAKS